MNIEDLLEIELGYMDIIHYGSILLFLVNLIIIITFSVLLHTHTDDPYHNQNILFVTAHPDDEVM